MKIEDLNVGDIFYCAEDDAWVMVLKNTRMKRMEILIIDSRHTYYLESDSNADAVSRWLDIVREAPKFRIGDVYTNFVRDINRNE